MNDETPTPPPKLGEIGLTNYVPYLMNRIMGRYNAALRTEMAGLGLTTAKMRALAVTSPVCGSTVSTSGPKVMPSTQRYPKRDRTTPRPNSVPSRRNFTKPFVASTLSRSRIVCLLPSPTLFSNFSASCMVE